jgi:hypothetical protein
MGSDVITHTLRRRSKGCAECASRWHSTCAGGDGDDTRRVCHPLSRAPQGLPGRQLLLQKIVAKTAKPTKYIYRERPFPKNKLLRVDYRRATGHTAAFRSVFNVALALLPTPTLTVPVRRNSRSSCGVLAFNLRSLRENNSEFAREQFGVCAINSPHSAVQPHTLSFFFLPPQNLQDFLEALRECEEAKKWSKTPNSFLKEYIGGF